MKPTYAVWAEVGCPEAFDESLATSYSAGETVESNGLVYKCQPYPESARCNQNGYQPGSGQQSEVAWKVLGSCSGTIAPTASPTRPNLPVWEKTGCPDSYDTTTNYEEGDTVSAYGIYVYKCKVWPDTGFCWLFSPENVQYGSLGWERIGGCSGTRKWT